MTTEPRPKPGRRGRRVLARLGLLVASVAMVLAAAELVARLTWETPGELRFEDAPRRERKPVDPDLPVLEGLYAIGRKNVRGIHKGVLLRTNSRRLRGPEYTESPAPGTFRIAITGDSVTMGSGVEEQDTYPQQLERMLNEAADGRRYEVINVGLDGVNATAAMMRLADVVQHYHPQLIVYGFTINDIEGPHYVVDPRRNRDYAAFWASAQAAATSPSYLWRVLWPRLVHLQAKLFPASRIYAQELEHNYFENPPASAALDEALDFFAGLGRSEGVCAHVLVHTHLEDLDEGHRYRRIYDFVESEARARGLTTTQSFPAFRGLEARPLWVGLYDPHPNREGHAILARSLLDGLRALPARCWER